LAHLIQRPVTAHDTDTLDAVGTRLTQPLRGVTRTACLHEIVLEANGVEGAPNFGHFALRGRAARLWVHDQSKLDHRKIQG
jgi:hypothetical protein